MADRWEHAEHGAITAVVVSLVRTLVRKEPIELGRVLLSGIGGLIGGRLPDIIEPPHHPNHRRMAHSPLFGLTSVLAAETWWSKFDENLMKADLLRALAWGIASHQVLDSKTPMGLP
jgi:hypothetical protein